ncbi:hypothetical protein PIB30_003066 [Stylosanthes scabra]|uniref:Uncharacterized protein n=1 Tax=Stylosanthes scabra TaxID=79078 RepID=A0ABU6X354_9FABA|nr:hypothetical protein [Stylosanthes scabra]
MSRNMNIHHQERSTFLPMLCSRPSIKDVSLPRWKNNNNPPSSSSSSNEPLSPRIGCMGQVKRNNKIAGFPSSSFSHKLISTTTTTTSSSSSSPVIIKYTKLKNIFITPKNLINATTPSTTRTTTNTIRHHHHHHQRVFIGKGNSNEGVTTKKGTKNLIGCSSPSSSSSIGIVSIDEMDPPLPVVQIKKEKVGEEDNKDSLWKRRKSGSLQSLQLQQHHPRISLQPTTV